MESTIRVLLLAGLLGGCYSSAEPFDDDQDAAVDLGADADADADGFAPEDAAVDDAPEELPYCGDEKEPRETLSRIVDGVDSFDPEVVLLEAGQVLAVGAMLSRDWMGGGFTNSCTATLVTDTTVLTAAHCVRSWTGLARPTDLRFAVGRDVAEPDYTFEIAEVHANDEYEPWGGGEDQARGDMAVLILAESAAEAVPSIRPIPVNRAPLPEAFLGTRVQNVGFGTIAPRDGDNTLRWWTVEEVTAVGEFDYTVYGGGVSSVCYGDSGGPGLWTFPDDVVRVTGTVSWGDPSCVDYDHFARTDYNLEFLLPYIGPDDPCGGLTWEGRCEGTDAVWCIDGVTYRRDCAACDQVCGDAGPSLGFYCL
ncbi:MAG: trypsin-like serine protease [Deltaproteobacteria bacterium]|nr:trypsin-like serine protease [Deltaproteobacteria bacterium]